MINKDFILRLAERMGRELAIILRLRKRDQNEEALIYIDDLLLQNTGFTSLFLNSLNEETLLSILSPLGKLNVEASLSMALLLSAEADIYDHMHRERESFYRSVKALYLLISTFQQVPLDHYPDIIALLQKLVSTLNEYELPLHLKEKLFWYYERIGEYAKAEDVFFELYDDCTQRNTSQQVRLKDQGLAFYQRLLAKSDPDLEAGNLPRTEILEGQAQLLHKTDQSH